MTDQTNQKSPLQNQNGLGNAEVTKSGHSPALAAWIEKLKYSLRGHPRTVFGKSVPIVMLLETLSLAQPGDPFLPELVAWLESCGMPDFESNRTGLTPLMSFASTIKLKASALNCIQLIAEFSDWDARDSQGDGVLESALRGGNPEVIAYVIAYQEQRALREIIPLTENQCSASRKTRTL